MGKNRYHVVGIGNAIVDVLAKTDDAFLKRHGMAKGGMTLIDEQTAGTLYGQMPAPMEQSGGSVANTMAAMAALGANCAFVGKVCDDLLGKRFTDAIHEIGVTFQTPANQRHNIDSTLPDLRNTRCATDHDDVSRHLCGTGPA